MNENSPGAILQRTIAKSELNAALEAVNGINGDLLRITQEEAASKEMIEAERDLRFAESGLKKFVGENDFDKNGKLITKKDKRKGKDDSKKNKKGK